MWSDWSPLTFGGAAFLSGYDVLVKKTTESPHLPLVTVSISVSQMSQFHLLFSSSRATTLAHSPIVPSGHSCHSPQGVLSVLVPGPPLPPALAARPFFLRHVMRFVGLRIKSRMCTPCVMGTPCALPSESLQSPDRPPSCPQMTGGSLPRPCGAHAALLFLIVKVKFF